MVFLPFRYLLMAEGGRMPSIRKTQKPLSLEAIRPSAKEVFQRPATV